jgi:hypothetical protein
MVSCLNDTLCAGFQWDLVAETCTPHTLGACREYELVPHMGKNIYVRRDRLAAAECANDRDTWSPAITIPQLNATFQLLPSLRPPSNLTLAGEVEMVFGLGPDNPYCCEPEQPLVGDYNPAGKLLVCQTHWWSKCGSRSALHGLSSSDFGAAAILIYFGEDSDRSGVGQSWGRLGVGQSWVGQSWGRSGVGESWANRYRLSHGRSRVCVRLTAF